MPIYEYQCEACMHKLEALQKIADEPLVDCPNCDQPQLRKLVSAAAFKLKGSGWYETDFKNKGAAPAGDKTASDSKQPAGDAAAKSGAEGSKGNSKAPDKAAAKVGGKSPSASAAPA